MIIKLTQHHRREYENNLWLIERCRPVNIAEEAVVQQHIRIDKGKDLHYGSPLRVAPRIVRIYTLRGFESVLAGSVTASPCDRHSNVERGGVRAVGREGELAHDKGYYHSYLGRSRKGAFGHTSRLSRSRGALSPAGP